MIDRSQTSSADDADFGPSSPPCVKCGEVYWGTFTEPFMCEDCKRCPWSDDENLRLRLEAAGWRYARLIGIVTAEEPEDVAMLILDRDRFAGLVRAHKGLPEWHCKEATSFVADLAGSDRAMAAAWLEYDWNGGEV